MSALDGSGFFVNGEAQGVQVKWLLDTGCRRSLLSWTHFKKIHNAPSIIPFKDAIIR